MSLSLLDLPVVPLPSRGNLFTRTLSDIVSKEDFVLDSEYLTTLLVIVPKYVGRKIMGVCCSGENEVGPLSPAGSGQQTLLLRAHGGRVSLSPQAQSQVDGRVTQLLCCAQEPESSAVPFVLGLERPFPWSQVTWARIRSLLVSFKYTNT